jgi:hypothetical protein
MRDIKTVFLGIVGNLITPFVVIAAGIAMSFYSSASIELKVAFCNIALLIAAIILILSNRFYHHRVRLIHVKGHIHQYIVENNTYKHIPDPETFNYLGQVLGFDWKDSEEITDDKFRKLSSGSTLPSVRQYFQAYYQQKVREDALQNAAQ